MEVMQSDLPSTFARYNGWAYLNPIDECYGTARTQEMEKEVERMDKDNVTVNCGTRIRRDAIADVKKAWYRLRMWPGTVVQTS